MAGGGGVRANVVRASGIANKPARQAAITAISPSRSGIALAAEAAVVAVAIGALTLWLARAPAS